MEGVCQNRMPATTVGLEQEYVVSGRLDDLSNKAYPNEGVVVKYSANQK